jgi:hypothetical protein
MERVLAKARQGNSKLGQDYIKSPVVEKRHHRSFSTV